jgi:hypothetical protein
VTQPAETTHRLIRVKTAAGVAVTGLTLASFTVEAYGKGYGAAQFTTYTSGAAITEIGGGRYLFSFALPSATGWWDVFIKSNTAGHQVFSSHFEGELESQDYDSLYANILKPVATLTTSAQLGSVLSLSLIAYRYRSLSIPIKDEAGTNIDLSGYTNLKMSVRSKDQTTTKWDAGPTATPVGFSIIGGNGILTIEIPEDAAFFSALTAGSDSISLYYEVTGDMDGAATKTIPIIRSSSLILSRREVGT